MGRVGKILVLNGPNLNMLGVREPEVYGTQTLAELEQAVEDHAASKGIEVECFQSNSESALIERIQQARGAFDGIVYNPAAHTHYSVALRDAVAASGVATVEVHLSDIAQREGFRAHSVIEPVCIAQIGGRGLRGYLDAIDLLLERADGREALGSVRSRLRAAPAGLRTRALGGGALSPCEVRLFDPLERQAIEVSDLPGVGESSALRMRLARDFLEAHGFDAFYSLNTSDIAWATAFEDVFDDERAHALLIARDRALLHTDSRYSHAARQSAQLAGGLVDISDERVSHARAAAGAVSALPGSDPLDLAFEDDVLLREWRALTAAVEEAPRSVSLRETSGALIGLRAVKDLGEIARLRAAQAVTDAAFAHIVRFMRPGMTEREVQIELEDYMMRHGARGLAFSSIVATGANGASPHAVPGDTRLEAGQCVVMDFGARAYGYCSDMTRTVFIGEPSSRLAEAYEVLRCANETVEAALVPGMTGREAHEMAEEVLARGGFGGLMGHGLGHGVGIDIHEQPNLSPRNDRPLLAGCVVTVEPGIYVPGEFGMRLEDCGVLTDEGYKVFGTSPHEMVII